MSIARSPFLLKATIEGQVLPPSAVLMTMGADLLAHGMAREVEQLDEKLYLEVYQPTRPLATSKKKARV